MGRPKGSKTVAPKAAKGKKEKHTAPPIEPPIQQQMQATTPEVGEQTEVVGEQAEHLARLFGAPPVEKKGKKKEEPEVSKQEQIDTLLGKINSQYKGRAILRQGSQITNVFLLRRPTGITTLDLKIGGGLPAGGLTQIIGKFSAGKSYLANKVMAKCQENYGENFAAFVAMTEMPYDKGFAKIQCGLRIAYSEEEIALLRDIQLKKGLPDFNPEQYAWMRDGVGRFVEGKAATAEGLFEVTAQMVEANCFQVVLIDSFGALLTKAEAEAEEGLEQKYRGGASTVVTAFMHRIHAALNLPDAQGKPNTTTIIGINQYRDNVNAGVYGNPMKHAGGNALAHGKLVDIHIEQGAKIRVALSKSENLIVGKEINWEILKGKAGCHDGPRGTYKLYLGEGGYPFGFDFYSDLLSAGLQAEVIQQSGAWYSYQGEYIGQGENAVAQTLYKNPEVTEQIRSEIFKKAGLSFIVRER
jgi:recombination protein RecA